MPKGVANKKYTGEYKKHVMETMREEGRLPEHGRKGNGLDNALIENFFGNLKASFCICKNLSP
jgi:transposase InsO family protein